MIIFQSQKPDTKYHVKIVNEETKGYENLFQRLDYKPKLGKTITLHNEHETTIIIGAGKPKTDHDYELIGANIYKHTKGLPNVDIFVDTAGYDDAQTALIASGLELRNWHFEHYRTKEEDKQKYKDHKFIFIGTDEKFKQLHYINEGNKQTRFVVSEPPNVLHPPAYAKIIKETLEPLGVKVTILDEAKMRELGLHALLCIGEGSQHQSQLVTMEYYGADKNEKPLALVGKGVTFDTGGISIKPSTGMEDMRYDMAGSGVVFGVLKTLALRKAKVNVVGVVGLVENMPSGTACRPSDIVPSYSGQTIEILNTDAEGRVVLADALWYAQKHFEPKIVIDLATLTGAITVALGAEYAGLFSNDDALSSQLTDAGEVTGEKLWRMPMCDAFDKDINSEFADVKNVGSGRGAGSCTAAHFLKRFIKEGTPWAHLDIAGVAWDKKAKDLTSSGATGFGVRLLNKYIKDNHEK